MRNSKPKAYYMSVEQTGHPFYIWLTGVLDSQAVDDKGLPRWSMYHLNSNYI